MMNNIKEEIEKLSVDMYRLHVNEIDKRFITLFESFVIYTDSLYSTDSDERYIRDQLLEAYYKKFEKKDYLELIQNLYDLFE